MSDLPPTTTHKQHRRGRHENTSSVTYMRVVEEVTKAGVTQAELAKAVGAGPRAVQNWASGQNAPRGATVKRLLDVRTIIELLSDSYTDEGIDIWLHARNRNLNMRRPIDLIVEGQIDTVIDEAKWVTGGM
ncbi:MAG: helix-turn-helix transcriptional regulator [Hyphomicrobiaceae bacterium]|nr:helix-turn-helix transcriptional regulator [Hyphomicrobiaceae bacterium]